MLPTYYHYMKKTILMLALLIGAATGLHAQSADSIPEELQSLLQVPADYMQPVSAGDFIFKVPSDCIVMAGKEKNQVIVKYPNGTFGVTATAYPERVPQKDAKGLCEATAKQMRLRNAKTEVLKINGLTGYKTTGVIETQMAHIIVASGSAGEHIEMIIINTDNHQDWTSTLLASLMQKSE